MNNDAPTGMLRAFGNIEDPRMDRTKHHSLTDIMAIAICATICGADGWVQVVEFGQCKDDWFKTFLDLPNGIPSHDTFGRVFSLLKPEDFEACFIEWTDSLAEASEGQLVAIDGKAIRRSLDSANDKAAIHMVSAWSKANNMVLGQISTDEKSNEITAIPKLLKLIELENAVVTIDAMGCQKKIAKEIINQNADYILQVKDNQPTLHENIALLFAQGLRDDCFGIKFTETSTTNAGHGRVEQRHLWATNDIEWLKKRGDWENLKSLIRVECKRTVNGETSCEYHYYITSLSADDPAKLLEYVRGHWSVENNLHWCLDISFADDDRRIRKNHGAENFSRLSRIALNLLKAQTKHKVGIKTKRLCCGWSNPYLYNVLTRNDQGLIPDTFIG